MSKPTAELRPFCSMSPNEDPQNVAALVRSAQEAPEDDFPRLRWRLRTDLRQRSGRPFFRMVLVTGGVFLIGGVVGAVVRPYLPSRPTAPVPARPDTKARPRPVAKQSPAPPPELAPAAVDEGLPSLVRAEAAPAPRRRAPLRLPAAPVTEPPAVPAPAPVAAAPAHSPSAVAVEQALLAEALRSLRKQRDPRTALALLEEHARRFSQTVLAPEAAMLRAEALLGLGRNAEALSELDRIPLQAMPKANDRLVLRGELRAATGRWREALDDFETQLSAGAGTDPASLELRGRALWGRASARSRLGDQAGAHADLAAYLLSYPSGRFAARAAALLQVQR
jgi:hypothetical protein